MGGAFGSGSKKKYKAEAQTTTAADQPLTDLENAPRGTPPPKTAAPQGPTAQQAAGGGHATGSRAGVEQTSQHGATASHRLRYAQDLDDDDDFRVVGEVKDDHLDTSKAAAAKEETMEDLLRKYKKTGEKGAARNKPPGTGGSKRVFAAADAPMSQDVLRERQLNNLGNVNYDEDETFPYNNQVGALRLNVGTRGG